MTGAGDDDTRVCGVDEAGRGPLAGDVFAAAVILDPARPIAGLADSKALTERQRDRLAVRIRADAAAFAIARASVAEIDKLNILWATMLAMKRAVEGLGLIPTLVLVDGNRCPDVAPRVRAVVQGDRTVAEISAASILAKTARDAYMLELHAAYPQYEFDRHKGYPTARHVALLESHGPCPAHRVSFGPVRAAAARTAARAAGGRSGERFA